MDCRSYFKPRLPFIMSIFAADDDEEKVIEIFPSMSVPSKSCADDAPAVLIIIVCMGMPVPLASLLQRCWAFSRHMGQH